MNGTEETIEVDEKSEKPLPVLSEVELFVQRQAKVKDRKEKIAGLASAIIENPEEGVSNFL